MPRYTEEPGFAESGATNFGFAETVSHFPRDEAYDEAFEPYAKEIGFFVRNWNLIHEGLLRIFINLVKSKDDVSAVIWQAISHDRTQRNMLKALAEASLKTNKKLLVEIVWLLKEVDVLGQQRDNVIHSPMVMATMPIPEFVPNTFFGHKRATDLKKATEGSKLIDEIQRLRGIASSLFSYSLELNSYLASGLRASIMARKTEMAKSSASKPGDISEPVNSSQITSIPASIIAGVISISDSATRPEE